MSHSTIRKWIFLVVVLAHTAKVYGLRAATTWTTKKNSIFALHNVGSNRPHHGVLSSASQATVCHPYNNTVAPHLLGGSSHKNKKDSVRHRTSSSSSIDIENYSHNHSWLTRFYHSWKDVPAGQLDESIVRNVPAALWDYAKRRTPRAAEEASALLQRYVAEYQAGNPAIRLDTTVFHAAMDAHAKCGRPQEAQAILRQMIQLSKSASLQHLKPDTFSYTILATAWAKSRHPQAADKAERFLQHMEKQNMTITTLTYNVVLNSIAVSHDKHKTLRAKTLVNKMERLANQTPCSCLVVPDLYTYQSHMVACSRTWGGLHQTLEILDFLKLQSSVHGRDDLTPNKHCFAIAIHAWAHSPQPNRAQKALQLLKEMRVRYEQDKQTTCRPNVVIYTSVINACVVNSPHPDNEEEEEGAHQESFVMAQSVFNELLQSPYGPPTFLTYAAFFHVCATALKQGNFRDSVVQEMFELCRKHGCLGRNVLDKFRAAASPRLQKELLGDDDTRQLSWDNLPHEWTHAVKGERYRSSYQKPNYVGEPSPPSRLGATARTDRYHCSNQKPSFIAETTPLSRLGAAPKASFGAKAGVEWKV